jgi:predicted RNA binding protein YcfA (HicA-like mRNA interferase family)
MSRALTAGTVMPLDYRDEASLRAAKLAWRETLNRDAALTVSAHRVATYFCEVATVDGIFPGQERMALEFDVSVRSIRDGIAALQKRGWIVVRRKGNGRTNDYALATNSVLVAAIEMRRQSVKDMIAQAHFERRSRSSDRQRFAGPDRR